MIEIIVLGVVVLLLIFSYYMGIFNKLDVKEAKFPGGFFIYYDYQGHINSATLFH